MSQNTNMNKSHISSNEEQNTKLESENPLAEQKNSNYIDIFSRVALPVAVFVLALATYFSNTKAAEDRMKFDYDTKRTELRQKEEDLFLKKSAEERSKESFKANFIQSNFALITASTQESRAKAEALAKATFSQNDLPDVLLKIAQVRESTSHIIATPPATVPSTSNTASNTASTPTLPSPSPSADYKAAGLKFVKASNYAQALQYFETATLLQPSDAEAWNFKAYAQMRTGNPEAALTSIQTSMWLRPADKKLQYYVMLNATKILCSLDRTADALSYLRESAAAFPELSALAQHDPELMRRCNFTSGSN